MESKPSATETPTLGPDTCFTPHPELIETDLEDELVLMEPESGKMFGLNVTGRVVWHALPEQNLGQIARALSERFGISYDEALTDTRELLEALRQAGLVTARNSDTLNNDTLNNDTLG
ncbi:MAG: PqqD family protein [Trueperaceae bacterium]|nr:PqqD family protein [Trueperaceae bacterium]